MHKIRSIFLQFVLCVVILSCSQPESANDDRNTSNLSKINTSIRYAKRFSIVSNNNKKIIYLYGNKNISETTATYIVGNSNDTCVKKHNTYYVKNNIEKIASLSSIYTHMICELKEINHIAAIENIDYYNNIEILKKFNEKKLMELSKGSEMDIEKTAALNPDIIFTFGMGNYEDDRKKLSKLNIPTVVIVDHLEENPLARAEWIKFFAAFLGKEKLADSIFNSIEKRYDDLKKLAAASTIQPTVLTEIKYSDVWYVPGGKSFAATFIKDANASYVWKDDNKTGSLTLSFEEVYGKAKDADYWLNLSMINTKKELLSVEQRYAEFTAFKKGNLYNNNKFVNGKGYSIYWESGIGHPEKVLSDLIKIFHPELKDSLKADFFYYKKIN
jgi:iron complex transport system substrate-binding protein